MISSIANLVYGLPHELPNDLRLRILGKKEVLGKSQIWVGTSSQSPFQKLNFGSGSQNASKRRYEPFLVLSSFTGFLYFVSNILPRIVAFNIPIKHNQQSACKSVQLFQPVVANVNVVSVTVRHCFHVVKSVLHHQRVFCLAKPIFLTVDTVTDTVNVYNVVRYVTSRHVRKVFPSTHSFISIPTQVYCPKKIIILLTLIYHWQIYFLHLKQNILPYRWLQIYAFQNVLSLYLKSHVLESIIMFLHH